jgi:hypothetical protein
MQIISIDSAGEFLRRRNTWQVTGAGRVAVLSRDGNAPILKMCEKRIAAICILLITHSDATPAAGGLPLNFEYSLFLSAVSYSFI